MQTHRANRKWPTAILISLLPLNWAVATLPPGFTGEAFFKAPALEQQDVIWQEIEQSEYQVPPPQDQAPDYDLDLLSNSANLVKVFQYDSIVMPAGRAKATHQFGTAAAVEMIVEDPRLGYTGVFRTGATGILRLSLAKANPASGRSLAFIPNLSLKLLRDGNRDTNILAMHSIEGQGADPNFFKHTCSNFPGPAVTVPLRFGLSRWLENALGDYTGDRTNLDERARVIPLAEASLLERDGTRVERAHAPYEIIFRPNPKFYEYFQKAIETATVDGVAEAMKAYDFRKLLGEEAFKPGETLFDLYVRDKGEATRLWDQHWAGVWSQLSAWWRGEGYTFDEAITEPPPECKRLGRLVLKSRFKASAFGDQLPFRHPTTHEDVPPAP